MSPTGVDDKPVGAGVTQVRTFDEAASGIGVDAGAVPVSQRQRVGLYHFVSAQTAVSAALHGVGAGFFWLHNPSATLLVALRSIELDFNNSAVTAAATGPIITLQGFSTTTAPTGAVITPRKRVRTAQGNEVADPTNTATLRTANTSLTQTAQEDIHSFAVPTFATGAGIYSGTKVWIPDEDEQVVLAQNEGIRIYQPVAGSTGDTRRFVMNIVIEEFTLRLATT